VASTFYSSIPDNSLTSSYNIPIGCPRIGRPSDYSQVQSSVQTAIASFNATINALLQNSNVKGLDVVVVQDQTVLYNSGFGLDKATGSVPTNKTVFRYGAITTLFTFLMVLKMRQDGQLSLNDYFSLYCPVLPIVNPYNNDTITLREMASHLSGLPKTFPYVANSTCTPYSCNITNDMAIQLLNGTSLLFAPLVRPSYSDLAYSLLGRFLPASINASISYEQYIINNFLTPINLVDTVFTLGSSQQGRLATPYNASGNPISGVPADANLGWNAPRGQLYGTNADLANLMSFLFQSQDFILNANTKSDLFLPLDVNTDGKTMYGTPFEMLFYKNNLLRMIRGDMIGYAAHMILIPNLKLGISVLSNTNADLSQFSLPLASALLDAFNLAVTNNAYPIPGNYTKYLGTYMGDTDDGTSATIVVQIINGQLAFTDSRLPPGVYIVLENILNTDNFIMHVIKDQGIISCLELYGSALNYDTVNFVGVTPTKSTFLLLQGLRFDKTSG